MNDATIWRGELDRSLPIEDDEQMEYGFLDEAMDDKAVNEEGSDKDNLDTETIDDDPDDLDDKED